MRKLSNTCTIQDKSVVVGITGCGGFIGSHVLANLLQRAGCRVLGVDICSRKISPWLDHPRFTFIEGDYTEENILKQIVDDSHVIISLASMCNPSQYTLLPLEVMESNFMAPCRLVNACRTKQRWLIHFSTSEVYGKTVSQFIPDTAFNPRPEKSYVLREEDSPFIMGGVESQRWCYASAKQLLERYIYACGSEGTMPFSIIRPFNFIGPNMDYIPGRDGEGIPRVLACFMNALMHGHPLQLVNGGRQKRCFTYIQDAVEAVFAMLRLPDRAQGHIFNIGHPENEITIAGLAGLMASLYSDLPGKESTIAPRFQTVTAESFYGPGYDDSDRRLPDISKARHRLGWVPQTPLKQALRSTMAWYVNAYRKEPDAYIQQTGPAVEGDSS